MSLPELPVWLVQWATVFADLVTSIASSAACYVVLRRLKARVEDEVKKL